MAKMTILDIVQDILSDMESDEVNSITDTVEAMEVAQIIKSTYYNLIDGRDWPHLYQFFQLNPSGAISRPTHMILPERVSEMSWVKYNHIGSDSTVDAYRKVIYKKPKEFMDILDNRSSTNPDIQVVTDPTGVKLNVYSDRAPTYWTSFDNEYIVFDSYDILYDTTLQTSKTQCYGKMDPAWTMSDTFVPDLPANAFSYLLNDSKSTCFMVLKQAPHQKAEQNSITQRRRMSQQAWRVNGGVQYPDYGRKR